MPTQFATPWDPPAAQFVREAYQFVATAWQHAARDETPDQGFERLFREHCIARLNGWKISSAREMRLGAMRETASGTLHEIDLVALHDKATAVAELKNYQISPDKNDVVVFHAKLID